MFERFLGRVEARMKELGVNRGELAARLGVGASTVSEWWTRGTVPRGDIFLRIPEVLGVRPWEFFDGGGEKDNPALQGGERGVEVEPIGDEERLHLLQLLNQVETALVRRPGHAP